MRAAMRLRQVLNVVNLSTPLGMLVAMAGRATLRPLPDGLLLAGRPRLLAHESRHATQYAWCLGPVMWPLYLAAAGWSWLRCRDFASYNTFERRAGLADGGYAVRAEGA